MPIVKIKQGNSTPGFWSLWYLEVKNQFESRQLIQPVFISSGGENFSAFAQSVWDKLIQESDFFDCTGVMSVDDSKTHFTGMSLRAEELMQQKYEEFESSILGNTEKIRANKEKSLEFQEKQIQRIGIENIRQSRLSRLQKEREQWFDSFQSARLVVPALSCLLMVNIVNE